MQRRAVKPENQLAGGFPTVETHSKLRYPYRLNFYDDPPLCNVTLEEFETWGIQRLRVLAEIESCNVRNRTFEDTKLVALAQSKKHLPLNSTSAIGMDRDLERKRDHVSHFVLRLAFCHSEELRRRFVKAETTLFKIRWESDDTTERGRFINSLDLGMTSVPTEEVVEMQPILQAASGAKPPKNDQALPEYFKVHWTRVTDLVAARKVYLRGGYAYVPSKDQNSIVFQEFASRLERALEQTSRAVPRLDEDDRLLPLLQHLAQSFLNGIASSSAASFADENGELVRAEQVDELAARHFPACMRNLHDSLRKDHHLRHHGRLQYGLFLKVCQIAWSVGPYKHLIDVHMRRVRDLRAAKAIGMSIDEALTFWRRGFQGGKITDDKFAKEYRYNIRHSYGLEGRRMNYPAKNPYPPVITHDRSHLFTSLHHDLAYHRASTYQHIGPHPDPSEPSIIDASCVRIITNDEPSSLDNHGCPFRHFSSQNLTAMLERSYRITLPAEQAEIIKLVQGHHYQIACTRVFEYTHRKAGMKNGDGLDSQGETVDHPNRYFTRSRELFKSMDKEKDNMDVDSKPPIKGELE
ncbi:DNA primase large subunit [Rhizoctonia solani]|uniref:DNA primase large subunit n=1 Tax=Rhizoctonia solani TaxID=456999 RepID=A0A8H8SXH9_9AGAM|nr:DNA primase large subunit [Rhizoctonia solani]QRW21519.1 DNA primase large subunit [Rhizoctonia solani]